MQLGTINILNYGEKNMNKKLFFQAITKFLLGVLIIGALLFIPAGTMEFWNGWLFMGLLFQCLLLVLY